MKDLREDQLLLLELANLCVANVTLSYSERNTAIWEAFRIGISYEISRYASSRKPPRREGREEAGSPPMRAARVSAGEGA